MVNGNIIENAFPLCENNVIYLPLRQVCELTGKTVYWESKTNTVKIMSNQDTIVLDLVEKVYFDTDMNRGEKTDVMLINDIAYVPINFFNSFKNIAIDVNDNFLEKTNIISVENIYEDNLVKVLTKEECIPLVNEKLSLCSDKELRHLKGEFCIDSNIGRYYVLGNSSNKHFKLLVNKYSGEIYCKNISYQTNDHKSALFIQIENGIPDLSFLDFLD